MSVQSKLDIKSKNIDTILVLDFGSQYTQLIARRIRESDVYSEILPWDVDIKKIEDINPKGIILSGGPESVTNIHTPRVPKIVFDLQVPILGICYGMQTLAEQMGGQVGVESDEGQGSTFWAEFPLCQAPELNPNNQFKLKNWHLDQ